MRTIGVDIGGTKIAAGVVDPDGKILDRVRIDTPKADKQAVESAVVTAIKKLTAKHEVEAVGLAPAGFVDADRARGLFAPNLGMTRSAVRDYVQRSDEGTT